MLIDSGTIRGVATTDGREFVGDAVILATGHSARDIYRLLAAKKILLESKPFAVGARIEHPQPLIDSLQYRIPFGAERPALLPAASYSLATKINHRGVHSFCMCPGGFIVPAATENDEIVVNGMSLARRDSPFANSGIVVTVEPEDTASLQPEHGALAGMAFQRELETVAKQAGGGGQIAPAQRAIDFVNRRDSKELSDTSYHPGLHPARLDELLPDWIVLRMRRGLKIFENQMNGYLSESANLVGFETRTSSPVRIPRDTASLQHPEVQRLFPCGEGAGFAGGIVSAAIDGIRCADAAAAG
ncbi:MAG: putative FAD-dependent dehydrogenase [Candidatus Binatia bacterium]